MPAADSPAGRALPWWAVFASAGWLIAYAVGLVEVRNASARTFQSDLVYAAPDLLGVFTSAWAARCSYRGHQGRAGAAWGWLTGACACSFLADMVYAGYYYLGGRDEVFPSWADGLWLLSDVAVLPAVVLAFARVSPLRQLRAALDALVALLGLAAVLWTLVLAPELQGGVTLAAGVTVAYPLLDLAVLVTLLSVGVGAHRRVAPPVLLLGAGTLLLAGTDLLSAYASDLHSYLDGSWCDLGWQAAAVLTCLAGLAAVRTAAPSPALPAGPDATDHDCALSVLATYDLDGTSSDTLLLDRDGLTLIPLLTGVGAVLSLVGVQAVRGGATGPSLLLAVAAVLTVLVRLLLSIADQRAVSRSLDIALAEQQRLAITDMLTELYNRRFIEELLGLEATRAGRDGTLLAILLIDLDRFKHINDAYGHQAGDAVLAEAAARLRRGLREMDVLGRWGGEEFLVVLRGADSSVAASVADRVHHELRDTAIRLPSGDRITVTASIGGAVLPTHGRDPDLLLHEADQALYLAKNNGRDQTRLPPSTPATNYS